VRRKKEGAPRPGKSRAPQQTTPLGGGSTPFSLPPRLLKVNRKLFREYLEKVVLRSPKGLDAAGIRRLYDAALKRDTIKARLAATAADHGELDAKELTARVRLLEEADEVFMLCKVLTELRVRSGDAVLRWLLAQEGLGITDAELAAATSLPATDQTERRNAP